MAKNRRPFRRLKGVSKENDAYSQKNDRRPFVFNFTTRDGGTIESQGNVHPGDVEELVKIFKRTNELHKRRHPQ